MTVLYSDTFTYANTGASGLDSVNANWAVQTGITAVEFQVSSNQVVANQNADSANNYSGISWPNDHYAQVTAAVTGTGGGGQGIGPAVRMAAAAESFYSMIADHAGSSNVTLTRAITGSYAAIGTRTQAWTDGATLRLEVQGTSLTLWIAGVQLGAAIVDANHTTGRAGIRHSSNTSGASLDNFEGGDFAGGAGVTDGWQILLH